MTTVLLLITALVLLAVVAVVIGVVIVTIWRATGRRPVPTAVIFSVGTLLLAFVFGGMSLAVMFLLLLAGAGVVLWRSRRVRELVMALPERVGETWFLISGIEDEIRCRRRPHQLLGRRIMRRVRANVRAGVRTEELQLPTTVLVLLHEDDLDALGPLEDELRDELAEAILADARERGYRTFAEPAVRFAPDPFARRRGIPHVKVSWAGETKYDERLHDEERTKVTERPRLRRVDDGEDVEVILDEFRPVVFGRDPETVDVVIDDLHVSRHHAEVGLAGSAGWVSDKRSRNWTLVNGQRVRGRQAIRDGDVITFGRDVSYEFIVPGAATKDKHRR